MKCERDIMALGAIIEELKKYPEKYSVWIDFALYNPCGLCSYRGYYDQLALNYSAESDDAIDVGSLLLLLKGAVGGVFEGYKGGRYHMGNATPVWVANYGYSGSTGIVGIEGTAGLDVVIIHTAYIE